MKQCQSCGMPLQTKKAGDCHGSEKDGGKSEKWCKLCYENGELIGPDCTLEQMKAIVDKALIENGSGKLMRWIAQKQLPHLERCVKLPLFRTLSSNVSGADLGS